VVQIVDEGAHFLLQDAEALHELVRMPRVESLELAHALEDLQRHVRAHGPHLVNAEGMFAAQAVFDLRFHFLEPVPRREEHAEAVAQDGKIPVLLCCVGTFFLFLPAGGEQRFQPGKSHAITLRIRTYEKRTAFSDQWERLAPYKIEGKTEGKTFRKFFTSFLLPPRPGL